MIPNPWKSEEPLRLALFLMLLALLLPLGGIVWLLLKNVHAERVAVRQQLMDTYSSQLTRQLEEKIQQWRTYTMEFPWDTEGIDAVEDWMREGGLDALLYVDPQGNLRYPVVDVASSPSMDVTQEAWFPWLAALENTHGPESPDFDDLATTIRDYLSRIPAAGEGEMGHRVNRRALLRLAELTGSEHPWVPELRSAWRAILTRDRWQPEHTTWRERGFYSRTLLGISWMRDDPEMRELLQRELQSYRLQEQLLRFFYREDWTSGETMERWLVFIRPDVETAGEPVFTQIKTEPSGTLVLQLRESVLTDRLASIWENPAYQTNLWIQVTSPSKQTYRNVAAAEIGTEPFSTLDMSAPFHRWKMEMGFLDDTFLIRTSRRETTFSVVAGGVMVFLIAVIGFFAVRQVNRQIQLNRLKNDFIGLVSHELRTPLASIRMLVETLLEGRYHDERTVGEYLGLMAGETERLSRLVERFLTFSRMQRGKNHLPMREVSVTAVVEGAVGATRPHMESPDVTFLQSIAPDLPPLHGDVDALVTVLVNLLENAYKYSNPPRRITLQAYAEKGGVVFAVRDNGIGIAPRDQRLIFREFYQVDNRLSRNTEGSGLGLSINRHIIRSHKGTIRVESEVGKGSIFRVWLPAHRSPKANRRDRDGAVPDKPMATPGEPPHKSIS